VSHDGISAARDWLDRYEQIERKWEGLKSKLESALPGGLAKANLYRVDLRPSANECAGILHFSTSEDIEDWYVRLTSACDIERVAPKD
jgi:hypothetical protein